MEIRISFEVVGSDLRKEIFESDTVNYGQERTFEEITIKSLDMTSMGAFESVDIVTIALSSLASIPATVISAWIGEQIRNSNVRKLRVNGREFQPGNAGSMTLLEQYIAEQQIEHVEGKSDSRDVGPEKL